MMKRLFTIITLFVIIVTFMFISYLSYGQNVAINNSGLPGANSAALDISSSEKGVLIPRVALTSRNVFAPITGTPTNSLLVYNTQISGVFPNDVYPGYYYWDNTASIWNRLLSSNNGDAWLTIGNNSTNQSTNFLGTTDNVGLNIRTNNLNRLLLCDNGNINIDPNPPATFPRNGKALIWSGTDVFNSWSNFSTDPFAMYRYDSLIDNSILRLTIGDNVNSQTNHIGDRFQFGYLDGIGSFRPTLTVNVQGDLSIGRSHAISRLDVTGVKLAYANGGNGTSNDAATQAIITSINGVSRQNDWPNAWGGGLSVWDICGTSTYFSAYFTRSDSTLKKDVQIMNNEISERFFKLRPVTYNLKNETPELTGKQYGFIAQEVGELFPTLVTSKQEESGTIGMNYQGLIAPTIFVVQKQQVQIDKLIQEISTLKKIIEEQNRQMNIFLNQR